MVKLKVGLAGSYQDRSPHQARRNLSAQVAPREEAQLEEAEACEVEVEALREEEEALATEVEEVAAEASEVAAGALEVEGEAASVQAAAHQEAVAEALAEEEVKLLNDEV